MKNRPGTYSVFRIMYKLFFMPVLILTIILPLFADSADNDFLIKQKRFVHELFMRKKYFDCIAETRRLLQYDEHIKIKPDYLYLISTCYYLGGQYKTVIANIEGSEFVKPAKSGISMLFMLSHSYSALNDHKKGTQLLNNLKYINMNSSERTQLLRNRIMLHLKLFSYGEILQEIEKADQYLKDTFGRYSTDDLKHSVNMYHELGLKSKWLSVSMSALLPGSGQIYSGRVMDGILSFLAVAGTAYGSYYCYRNNEKPLAFTLSFFTGLFYAGNLYGAYNSSEFANLHLKRNFNKQLIKKYDLYYHPEDYINNKVLE
ncbi:MAG: hypothetical protein JW864_17845 [Spirochaetes bacterium]|nr:hypothetical protein [Spirochaetota bacterium]